MDIPTFSKWLHQFITVTGVLSHKHELSASFNSLDHSTNPDTVTLVTELLDECDRLLEEWNRCQERCHKILSLLADEVECTARILREASRRQTDPVDFFNEVQKALALADSGIAGLKFENLLSA